MTRPLPNPGKDTPKTVFQQLNHLKETMSNNLKEGGEMMNLDGSMLFDLIGKDQTTEGAGIGMIDHTDQAQVHRALREMLIYCCFMVAFTITTVRGLNDADVYKFGANIEGQLAGVEMLPEHSPTWGKNFNDISTVEEYYHWLQGPFVHTIFSPSTFDGDNNWSFQGGVPKGYMLGYGKILGAVRISQLRVESQDCTNRVPDQVAHYYNFTCYGDHGRYSSQTELKNDYGTFGSHKTSQTKPRGTWRFDGYSAYLNTSNDLVVQKLPEGKLRLH
jgi:hypothetical protein